jgi:putative AdoMet-dependent methyltransferase
MGRIDPFPAGDFDEWADAYDSDVVTQHLFPFAGYQQVLESVLIKASARTGMTVLDIGTGTGNLAKLFMEAGCQVWGTDFSPAMLAKARHKLPEATLVLHDLRSAWPAELDRRFERIVSAYTFHHFELDHKVMLVTEMIRDHLEDAGRMLIADVSFPSLPEMRAFAEGMGDLWEEEPYWLADAALAALENAGFRCTYEQVSACGGVYGIERA